MIEEIHKQILLKRRQFINKNISIPDLEIWITPSCRDKCLAHPKANSHIDVNRRLIDGYPYFLKPGQAEPFLIHEHT